MASVQQFVSQDQGRRQYTQRSLNSFVPFVPTEEGWNIGDDEISTLYDRIKEDGLADIVFFDRSIDSAESFINTAKAVGNLVVFIYCGKRIAGFAWLNQIRHGSAFCHFCLCRDMWGSPAREIGRQIVDYWMSIAPFQVLLGTVPSVNRKAVKYVRDLGFEVAGRVPRLIPRDGEWYSADIVYFERRG